MHPAVSDSGAPVTGPHLHADPEEFEKIFRSHADFVYHLACRLTRSVGEADDLLQETFVRVYRFLPRFRGGSLKSWLYRIVVNLFLTRSQARSSWAQVSLEQDEEGRYQDGVEAAISDRTWDPAERLEQVSLDERLETALGKLPKEFRAALVLREIQDLTYEEIAQILDAPIGTVRSRLARARALLRAELGQTASYRQVEP